jgi:hypothetical protein
MKKTIKALKLPSILFLMIISFIACDKEFSIIESDVLGKENSNFITSDTTLSITAYNKKLEALQINGLASYLLGVYNDPAYGQSKASIITQISPTVFNPSFGNNPVIDSVILRIPYFSRVVGADDIGNSTYTIQDSLYGNGPMKLTIYQNNYFLRSFDPNDGVDGVQNYYSKADGEINTTDNFALNGSSIINFDANKGATIIDTSFTPSAEAIELWDFSTTDTIKTRITPALRMHLDTLFWKNTIIDKEGESVLSNANNFNDYFRGLYFKAEAVDNTGSMVLLNLASSDANITIYYNPDSTTSVEDRTQNTYVLNFTGNRLNTFINDYNPPFEDGDDVLGDEKLYVKGKEGSMVVVDLFEDAVALKSFIDEYRVRNILGGYVKENGTGDYLLKKLINEAQLIVYEDEIMQTFPKDVNDNDYSTFDRIYAYDIKNNIPTIDYILDPTENSQQAFSSKVISLGQRLKDDNGVAKYKIRLTEHLNNILLKDSTNTKIGLILSTNVNYTNNAEILQSSDPVTALPAAALLTPRGTILYGSKVTGVDESKKMRLEVFFTKPNN